MCVFLTSLLSVATVTNGLLAGVFFVFSCAVVPGLRRVDDRTFACAFQAINRAILNSWFLSVFIAAPVTGVACAALTIWKVSFMPTLIGAAAGGSLLTFAITAVKNVPLNNQLDRATLSSPEGLRVARQAFERPWTRWNLARTLTSLVAFGCFVVAGILA
ncbi:anthrone oxygenase family protein [Propionimicrobium sp. PCR01-08-3]|uniref:anthrone oxygenase family protein n=1 Tax=Propionimicrobium sp. PCR01-08-3 TaxID=3052086 RepID=UPI00255D07B1|nr:anthrone oxygenase family protein [Propionimicrobium sp. PCR01-08-3]WIY82238.1 DUF1772 domain-containing protein [Propionimicrobium sp. PCR01-08-3]